MIELAHARELVLAQLTPGAMAVEMLPLHAAHRRIAAADLRAPRDVPGFANSAMDGFALRAIDLSAAGTTRLRVRATLLAGGAPAPAIEAGECVRIMTGAPLPVGADTVVIREHTAADGEHVLIAPGTAAGSNVRAADDDFAAGALAVPAGAAIDAAALGVLASFGSTTVPVRARPRIGVLVSGDELIEPGTQAGFGQRYDSNRSLLTGLIDEHGAMVSAARRVGDDPLALEHALRALCAVSDLVVSTGGASAGDADFLPALLARIGQRVFWKVAMKPGMPVFFGSLDSVPVFGLPGNPVSVFATFMALLRPALARLLAAPHIDPPPFAARLLEPLDKRHPRLEFRRARLRIGADGVLQVSVHGSISSGALRSVIESDALVELDAAPHAYKAGDIVRVHRIGIGQGAP